MKKKLKDLTVGKLYEYCKEKESCDDCPFRNFNYYCTLNTPYDLEEDALEQEVEIPDEPIGNSEQLSEKQIKLNVTKDISEMVRNERYYHLEECAKESFEYAYSKGMSDALEWVEKVLRKY